MEVLVRLPFPGNVRQLENLCHWMTVMAPSQTVQLEDLPAEIRMPHVSELQHVNGLSPSDSRVSQVLGSDQYRGGEVIASSSAVESPRLTPSWQELLRQEVSKSLAGQMPGPDHGRMNHWSREFESAVLGIALKHTRGRRMEAAQLLGIGRNTMTRKIADLHLEDDR
jgi:two-component system nitrogen regulation response regulator GlnG